MSVHEMFLDALQTSLVTGMVLREFFVLIRVNVHEMSELANRFSFFCFQIFMERRKFPFAGPGDKSRRGRVQVDVAGHGKEVFVRFDEPPSEP